MKRVIGHFVRRVPVFFCVYVSMVFLIEAQQAPIYKKFGAVIIDANKPGKLESLRGTINSVSDGIVILDIYISKYHALPAEGNARIGAYSAGGSGYSTKEFDRTVAITNFPGITNATIDKEIRITALRIGTFKLNASSPIQLYDCGVPYVPPPPTAEQIKAAQEAALAQKKKLLRDQTNAVRWLGSQASNGIASAQCSLGLHYLNGEGCETNRELGLYWLNKAADQGDAEASRNLRRIKE